MRRRADAKTVTPMRPMRDWIGGGESAPEIAPILASYGRAGLKAAPHGTGASDSHRR